MDKDNMLRSAFAYNGVNQVESREWALFKEMVDNPEKTVPYVTEILHASKNGKIDYSRPFNLGGYCYKIQDNLKKKASSNTKRETYFSGSEDDEEEKLRGGISYNRFVALEAGFETLENNDELMSAINTIKSLRTDFLEDEGVDLVLLLKRTKEFLPQAINKMKQICEEFELIGEQMQIIIKSGRPVEELFEM